MYTKVFRTIYDGTLADNWQALVTFQQLLILANDDGVVDMTIGAIHRTTGIPLEVLEAGIKVLEAPDQGSRTPDMEGRRIARLDEHRDWGWFLVNFAKYRRMLTREEKREADRARIHDKRNAEKNNEISDVATCRETSQGVASSREMSQVSQNVADVAHTDLDTEKSKSMSAPPTRSRFEEFWSAYPQPARVARKQCEMKWRTRKLDRVADRIIGDVRRRIAEDRRWREGFVPNAATYLNQERWNDGDAGQQPRSGEPSEQPDWMQGVV